MSFFTINGGYTAISVAAWRRLAAGVLPALGLAALASGSAIAQNATWNGASSAFGDSNNWLPTSVPTATATFANAGSSNVNDSLGAITIGTILFSSTPNAQAYTFNIDNSLTLGGSGITNNSTNTQIFNITSTNPAHVIFDNGSSASNGTGAVTINNSGFVLFDNTSTAGTARIANGEILIFSDMSTAGSAIIVNNAYMEFAFTGSGGNATITNNNNLVFLANSTGGNAQLIANASGIVDFSQTSGPHGDGHVSAGSIAGAGNYFLGADQLTVGSNNLSTVVNGRIADGGSGGGTGGSLVKVGTGTLVLENINAYTGSTTVNAGTLEVDGSIASSSKVTVNAGGTLSGVDEVGAGTGIITATTTIMSGGTLAPGNAAFPTGTMAILGNLAFQSGAIYRVQVTPTAAASTRVNGTATLGGASVNAVFANGSYISKTYTILTALGGLSGAFAPNIVNTNLPANFSDTLSYDGTHAYLNLTLYSGYSGGLNQNQQAISNALTNFFNTTGGISAIYGTLTPAGLTQASGESATGAQQTTFDAMGLFLGLLTDPFMNRGGGANTPPGATGYADEALGYAASRRTDAFAMFTKAPPAAPFEQRWSVWSAGFGGSQTTDGNATVGSNNTTSSVFGTAVGADYLFSPNTIAGFALAGGGTNFSVNGMGSGHSDLFQAGAYVRHTEGAAYVSAALAYGWQDITTNRTVAIAGIDQLRAEFNANAFSGRVEGGYRLVAPWTGGIGITPYAAGQFTTFDLPAYAESVLSGAGALALAYGAKEVTDARSEFGVRTDKSFIVQGGILTLRSRLAWAHDFDPDRSIAATFQSLPGASFVVNGAAQAADSALTTASIEMKWRNGWSAAATFEGEFSDVTSSYAGKGVVRYQW
jgi:autotransporter-associated beta strand protein